MLISRPFPIVERALVNLKKHEQLNKHAEQFSIWNHRIPDPGMRRPLLDENDDVIRPLLFLRAE